MIQDEDSCSEEDVEVQYELWRNATDAHYPLLTRRCWDDSADSIECMFLNNMALWICLLTFMVILMVLLCAAFFYLLLVKGNFVWRHQTLINITWRIRAEKRVAETSRHTISCLNYRIISKLLTTHCAITISGLLVVLQDCSIRQKQTESKLIHS